MDRAIEQPAAQGAPQDKQPNQTTRSSEPAPIAVKEMPKASETETQQREREVKAQEATATYSGYLVILTGLTLAAVASQSIATYRAVAATRASVEQNARHFELLNEQWLDVSFVRVQANELIQASEIARPNPNGIDRTRVEWIVRFKITNNTPLPVRIVSSEVLIEGMTTTEHNPRTLTPTSVYRPRIDATALAPATLEAMRKAYGIHVNLYGCVTYINAQRKTVRQCFGRGGWVDEWDKPNRLKDVIAGADSEDAFRRVQASEAIVRAKLDAESKKA